MLKSVIGALGLSERKRAVNELRKNEVRLEEAQRIANFGWWEREFTTNRVLLSDELCRIFGVQPADIPEWHQRWLNLIHPNDRGRVAEAAATALGGGPRYDVEYRVIRPDGAERVVHSRGDVTWDDAGKPSRQFGVLQDVTELRQAERELRKNVARLEEAQRIAHFGWWEWDLSSNRLLVSDELCRIFGVQSADIPTFQRALEFIHPEDRPRVAEAAATDLRGGPRYDVEYRVVRPDGRVRVVHGRGDVASDDAGQPSRRFGIVQDITDLREAERELRASEARFRTFVDHAMDAFFLLDDRLTVIDVNRQACDSLGYSRDELIGMHPRDFDAGLDESSIERLRQRIAAGETLTFETRHRRKDGTSFPVEIRSGQFEPGGRLLCLVRDITERKRGEDALRASEERFRTLVQFSFDAYWESDAQHRFIRQEFAEGLADAPPPGSEIGKTRWEVPYLEPDEEAWRKHRETLDAHLPFRDFELARPTPDGGTRYVSVSGMPMFDDKGDFVGYRGVGRHITERKRSELAIRESEERFRTLFDKANDAIFLENERDEIVEVNERACAMLGYSRQELLTMKVSDLQAPEMREQAVGVIRGELERHGDAPFETVDLHRSGRRILVEVTNTPIFDHGHKLVLSVARDVTERKRAAEALQQMHEQLAHANRVATMGQLTASIAHEIAQPIGAVYNRANAAINFLNRNPTDLEEVREAISRIADAADRAREIIVRIREQVKKAPPQKDCFDLNEAIEEVLLLANNAITKDAIAVQTGFAKGLPPVQGDRVQLQQVALNLILNAMEAMRSVDDRSRKLQITTQENEAGGVLVTVSDTGPGIPPETLERVFESFFTTKSSGMGIGLSICRSIVEAHGGSLRASANEPRGATFQFSLPGAAAGR
jgi:PAS domain S-box-containing protein